MRNPILSRLTKISRLPSLNMDTRLDSSIDTTPTLVTASYQGNGFGGTSYSYGQASYLFNPALGTQNVAKSIFSLSGTIVNPDEDLYTGYLSIQPTSSQGTFRLSDTELDSSLTNTQIDEYTFGGSSVPPYPIFGITSTGTDIPTTSKKMRRSGDNFNVEFIIPRVLAAAGPNGRLTITLFFGGVEANETTGRFPVGGTTTLNLTLRNITPGSSYGSVVSTGTISLNEAPAGLGD
jgi:hypothetical protein